MPLPRSSFAVAALTLVLASPTWAGDPVPGQSDYLNFCATCHGQTGAGDGPVAAAIDPPLVDWTAGEFGLDADGDGRFGTREDMIAITADGASAYGGNPLMAPSPLSAQRIDDMVDYIRTFLPFDPDTAIVYEFRSNAASDVIGTLSFRTPPAFDADAWSSMTASDLVGIKLDVATFGDMNATEGPDNNLRVRIGGFLAYGVSSDSGAELDGGAGLLDDTPGGAAGGVSDFFEMSFSNAPGGDVVESFQNAAFVQGDWTLAPEPASSALGCTALVVLAALRRRWRQASSIGSPR